MADVAHIESEAYRNGHDHEPPPPAGIAEPWDRGPQAPAKELRGLDKPRPAHKRSRSREAEIGELWISYYSALKVIRGAFGKRTLGSDQRLVDRAYRVSEAHEKLLKVSDRLGDLGA